MPERPPQKPDPSSGPRARKKPYRRPEILSAEPMELVASVCSPPGKTDLISCPSGPPSS